MVARQAHNLEVAGSIPAPAIDFGCTEPKPYEQWAQEIREGRGGWAYDPLFCAWHRDDGEVVTEAKLILILETQA